MATITTTTLDEPIMTAADAERARLSALAGISERDDLIMIELLYMKQWVRFDISALEMQHLSSSELFARYFVPALKDLHVERPAEAGPSSSDDPQPVSQE